MKRHFFVKKDKIMEVIDQIERGCFYFINSTLNGGTKNVCIKMGNEHIETTGTSMIYGDEKVLIFSKYKRGIYCDIKSINIRNIKSICVPNNDNNEDKIYYFI